MDYNYNTEYMNDEYYVDNETNNFFDNNYIWIAIVVCIIIIMTIIGYLADKYNLIKKKKKKTKEEQIHEKIKNFDDVLNNASFPDEVQIEQDKKDISSIKENLNINNNDVEKSKQNIDNNLEAETNDVEKQNNNAIFNENTESLDNKLNTNIHENNEETIDNLSTFTEDIPNKIDNSITDMYELADDDDLDNNQNNNELIDNNKDEEDDQNIVDMELPDLDSIKTDDTPDDFWKF